MRLPTSSPAPRPDARPARSASALLARLGRWAVLVALVQTSGCAASASMRAARAGDVAALRSALADEARRGALDDGEARDLAQALAEGAVLRARSPAELAFAAGCPRPLEDALETRAEPHDEAGAASAMILLESGLAPASRFAPFATRGGGDLSLLAQAYRALGARALVDAEHGPLRRALVVDGDQAVRVAALRAAIDAGDPADARAVLEAARLDPYPLARTMAIRAAGAIGGRHVVFALRDLWATADDAERQAIADAWGALAARRAGGEDELFWAEDQPGAGGIDAALVLARGSSGGAQAFAVLARAVRSGPTRDRVFAISAAPLGRAGSDELAAAIRDALADPDEAVALAAAARLLESRAPSVDRAALVKRLLAAAEGGTARAVRAKGALARAGVAELVPVLLRDAASRDVRARAAAGASLAVMGRLADAARLLPDEDRAVRLGTACAILRR